MEDTENQVKKDTIEPRHNIYEPAGETTAKILYTALIGHKTNNEIMQFYNKRINDLYPIQTGIKNKMTPTKKTIKEKTKEKLLNRKVKRLPEIKYKEEITYPEQTINPNTDNTLKQTTCDNAIKWLIKNHYLTGTTSQFEINSLQLLIDIIRLHECIGYIDKEDNNKNKINFLFIRHFLINNNEKRAGIYIKKAKDILTGFNKNKTAKERFEILRKQVPAEAQKYYLEYFLFLRNYEKLITSRTDQNYIFNNTKNIKSLMLFGFMYVMVRIDKLTKTSEEIAEYYEEFLRRQDILCYLINHSNEETKDMIEEIKQKESIIGNELRRNYAKSKEQEKTKLKKKNNEKTEQNELTHMKSVFNNTLTNYKKLIENKNISLLEDKQGSVLLKETIKEAEEKAPKLIQDLIEFGQTKN